MITINDIAKMAGVSKATVSRALNHSGYVKEETRVLIEQIMKEQHYVPSAGAVSLSRQESNTVGIVVPELDNMFYSELLRGITEKADENHLLPYFFDTQNQAEKEEQALRTLGRQRVRGLILGPAVDYSSDARGAERMRELQELQIPVVIVDRETEQIVWDGVFYENFESSRCAACELAKAGGRRIAVITGDLKLKIGRDRLAGFQKGIADSGLKLLEQDIYRGDFSMERAYRLSKRMLAKKTLPDAVYTSSNRTSIGFLKAANEAGIRIGKDIAVIGNDRLETLDLIGIPFSCVSRDSREMGRIALQTLMERMEHPKAPRKVRRVPFRLELKGTEKKS